MLKLYNKMNETNTSKYNNSGDLLEFDRSVACAVQELNQIR